MDVEWTLAKGRFAIVQARPITSLPEPPVEWIRPHPKALMARGSFAEFVPDAVSPLFATLAIPITEEKTQKLMHEFLGSGDKTYVFDVINGYVYMGMQFSAADIVKMVFKSISMSARFLKSGGARWAAARASLLEAAGKWQGDPSTLTAPELLAGIREIYSATAFGYTVGQSGPIGGAPASEFAFTRFYTTLVKTKSDPKPAIFLVGMESIPLRAEKSLYDLATWAKDQPGLADFLLQTPAETICAGLSMDPPPAPLDGGFASRFADHLARFGHILYDLDFAKPVAADDPAPLLEMLKVYLSGRGTSPYDRLKAQAEARERAETAISQRLDPLRRRWFVKLVRWAQKSGPEREDCIADLGLGYPRLRALALEMGRRLAAAGAIARPEDVYFLEAREVDALAAALERGETLTPHHDLVDQRKAHWQRMRNVTPPMSLPQKSFIGKMLAHDNPEGNTLKGYATSAGKVTARACVLRGPEEFGSMRPGDVIVAVTTTPAWTPLFAMASAVVTDIGGPLSHSSIVAREYGIPAVMATGVASKRIRSGQTITVDGNAGIITLQA
jgi:pyruvate,water dikinase